MGSTINSNKKCTIEDCEGIHSTRGMCHKHYEHWRVTGDPIYKRKIRFCSTNGCNRKYYAKGLCRKHYDQKFMRNNYMEYKKKYRLKNSKKIRVNSTKWDVKKYRKEYYQKNKLYFKNYRKTHPEIQLKSCKKFLKKLCIELNKDNIKSWNVSNITYALRSWSQTIKERDNHTCQYCGSKEKLHAHHIFYRSKHPKLCLNENNGVTLCHTCHWGLHRLN